MNRFAILVGIAALAFVSCVGDTLKEINSGDAIDFRIYAQTRAEEFTSANLNDFYVTALYENNDPYFENLHFIRNENDVFKSMDSYHWPNSGELNFYAYAPSSLDLGGNLTISGDSNLLKEFTPSTVIADQQDFIFATATGTKEKDLNKSVNLKFEHLLSQIEVRAKNARQDYIYTVAGVRISDVVSQADFDFDTKTWSLADTKKTYETLHTSSITIDEVGTNIMGVANNAMLIPQNLSSEGMNANLQVFVNVTSQTGYKIFPETGEFGWISVPISTEWKSGFKYIYTLDLTNAAAMGNPIKFTLDVDEWQENPTVEATLNKLYGKWEMSYVEVIIRGNDGTVKEHLTYDNDEDFVSEAGIPWLVLELEIVDEDTYITADGVERSYNIVDNRLYVDLYVDKGSYMFIRDLSDNILTFSDTYYLNSGTSECVSYYTRVVDDVNYDE